MVRSTKQSGFTLVEMMIVVVIIGVLSAIAIPSFIGYMYKARTAEATTFIGDIRARQESYRSEFGQYCGVTGWDNANWEPRDPGDEDGSLVRAWSAAPGQEWLDLGAQPDGPVRFSYRFIAGLPGDDPPANIWADSPNDFWYAVQAVADLDNDGTFITFEAASARAQIWKSNSEGWE